MMSDHHNQLFDQIWRRKLDSPGEHAFGKNRRVEETIRVLGSTKRSRLLDIGCGDGLLLERAQAFFDDVCGIDISPVAVEEAQSRGLNVQLLNLNNSTLPFADGYFEVVSILSSLQYFYDLEYVIAECHRVLAPEGKLIISVPNMRATWRILRLLFIGSFPRVSKDVEGYDGGTLHYFAYKDLVGLLSRQGFSIERAKGIHCIPTLLESLNLPGPAGAIKREFFSAEMHIEARKIRRPAD